MQLRIVGPFGALSGYSKMTRVVLRTALVAGFEVEAVESDFQASIHGLADGRRLLAREYREPADGIPYFQAEEVATAMRVKVRSDAPTLMIQIPERLASWHEYSLGPRIGWTMVESDRLNAWWARAVEGVDLLLAPSLYCLNTFRRDSPHVTSALMPIPVDDRVFHDDAGAIGVSRRGTPRFLFFAVFSPVPRKGWQLLMQAFAEEFRTEAKEVGLLVKPTRVPEVRDLSRWCCAMGAWVHLLDTQQSDEELAAWYRACDCYALPSAEGFGLPYVEAALCGKPSVALDRGGAADVVTEETGYPTPSHFASSIGHAPHIYDSMHLFPTGDIGSLRLALRAAYVDRASKGSAARERALRNWTPTALVDTFRERIIEGCDLHAVHKRMWSLPSAPRWALCVGDGYGDAMAAYGSALDILAKTGGENVGFVHYGFNPGVTEFLGRQPRAREVVRVEPPDKAEFQDVADRGGADYTFVPDRFFPHVLRGTDLRPDDLALTQARWPWGSFPAHRPQPGELVLSDDAERWARCTAFEIGAFFLVQPYSTNTVTVQNHWALWPRAIDWLLRLAAGKPPSTIHLPGRLVFCGLTPMPELSGANAVNLIGATPSMEHVLALAGHARAVFTTCNALALWTAVRGIPALVSANAAISRPTDYYYRWIDTGQNMLLPFDAAFADWRWEVVRLLNRIGVSTAGTPPRVSDLPLPPDEMVTISRSQVL